MLGHVTASKLLILRILDDEAYRSHSTLDGTEACMDAYLIQFSKFFEQFLN